MITTNDSTPSSVINISDGSTTHHTNMSGTTPKTIAVDNHTISLNPANNNGTTSTLTTAMSTDQSSIIESNTTDILSSEGAPIAPTSTISNNNTSKGYDLSTTDTLANASGIATLVSSGAATATGTTDNVRTTDDSTRTSIIGGNITHITWVEIIYHAYMNHLSRFIFLDRCSGI